jgi:PEGA domain
LKKLDIHQIHHLGITMRTLFVTALAATLFMGGCATITRGSSQTWVVETEPSGAEVKLSTGQTCITPCSLNLKRKTAFTAEVVKPGFASKSAPVSSSMDGKGTLALFGNIIFGGVIGIGVDVVTGATNGLKPNPLKIDLRDDAAAAPAVSATQNQ